MRKILPGLLAVAFCGCYSEANKEPATPPPAETATPLYTATYSSKFEMGDAKHTETVLQLWKAFEDGKVSDSRKYFADTVHLHLRSGMIASGPADSALAKVQALRDMLASAKSTVHAYLSVKSTDKGDNWVNVWGEKVYVDKQGKKDSLALEESWRFNKAGKIDVLYQFARPLSAPASK